MGPIEMQKVKKPALPLCTKTYKNTKVRMKRNYHDIYNVPYVGAM